MFFMEPFRDAVELAVNRCPMPVDLYEERADHGGDGKPAWTRALRSIVYDRQCRASFWA